MAGRQVHIQRGCDYLGREFVHGKTISWPLPRNQQSGLAVSESNPDKSRCYLFRVLKLSAGRRVSDPVMDQV